jgi:hypothetical protein
VIQFKDICDGKAYTGILVGNLYRRPVIEVGATGEPQFSKKLRQRASLEENELLKKAAIFFARESK